MVVEIPLATFEQTPIRHRQFLLWWPGSYGAEGKLTRVVPLVKGPNPIKEPRTRKCEILVRSKWVHRFARILALALPPLFWAVKPGQYPRALNKRGERMRVREGLVGSVDGAVPSHHRLPKPRPLRRLH